MRWFSRLRLRCRSLLRAGRVERELDEEFRFHLDHLTDDYLAQGMSPAEARSRARREMGSSEARKEECRDARGVALIDSLRQDVVYAVRALRKSPAFSIAAILSLALGIGATTTIFSFVNAVLLRPLPYPDAHRLVVLHERPAASLEALDVHPAAFVEWRARARSFDALALTQSPPLNVMGSNGAEQIGRLLTTPELFRVFGVRPALGRGFTDEESRPGGPPVVILGYGFWQRWFGGDPRVLGRRLALPDGSLTIVGVGPPGFSIGLLEPDAFTPLAIDPANPGAAGSRAFQCYGRLRPGVALESAAAEMRVMAAALARHSPASEGMTVTVASLHSHLARDARPGLRVLMAAVATLLAIACVNLAGLLLARGTSRRGEFALRAALGAGRRRLMRQLALESLVLSLCGGAAGLLIASLTTPALAAMSPPALMGPAQSVRLDTACLLFTFVVSAATALAFGFGPARQAGRADPQDAIRDRTRSATPDRRQHRTRTALVTTQVALSLVLLVGAGLLLRTMAALARVDLGFQPSGTVAMSLFLGLRPPDVRIDAVERLLDRVERVPGVRAAGTIQFLPLTGMTCGTGFWREDDAPGRDPARALPTECALVSRGYFAAMAIPLLQGRGFDRRDRADTPRVLVVNQAFARTYFPDGRVLGRRALVQASNQALAEIVGIVGDVRHGGFTAEPAPTVYLLHAQTPGYITNLVIRTEGDPLAHVAGIRQAIHEADPTQAVSSVRPLQQDVARVLARPRLYAVLLTGFALCAAVLAAVGVYGSLSYAAAQRTHEIGIRLALGAGRGRVFRNVAGHGAALVAAGLAGGVAAALAVTQALSTVVFGVTTKDPATYLLASLVLSATALVAVAIPAYRASRVQPIRALRCE